MRGAVLQSGSASRSASRARSFIIARCWVTRTAPAVEPIIRAVSSAE